MNLEPETNHKGDLCLYYKDDIKMCQEGDCLECEAYQKINAKIVKCEDCKHCEPCYLTGYDGTGTFETGQCQENISKIKLVDPQALRLCEPFAVKGAFSIIEPKD